MAPAGRSPRTERRSRPIGGWQWAWGLAIAVVILLGFWWIPGYRPGTGNTFSAATGGKKAFYELVAALSGDARRHLEGDLPPRGARTLVILGPARYPDRRICERLLRWVRRGNTLVVAARLEDPGWDLAPFGVRVVPRRGLFSGQPHGERLEKGEDLEEESTLPAGLWKEEELRTDLAEGDFEWRSFGRVVDETESGEELAGLEEAPQVIRVRVGSGWLVVSSSDYVFTNDSLAATENVTLAYRILECGEPRGPIAFDETLNKAGAPQVVGILFDPALRRLTLEVLLVTILFGWWGSRRFGAGRRALDPPRRSLTEHARALGNLYYKAGAGAHVVGAYLEYFRHEMRDRHALGASARSEGALARSIARRAGLEENSVARLLEQAGRAGEERGSGRRGAAPGAGRAARTIRALAQVRDRLEGAKGGDAHGA